MTFTKLFSSITESTIWREPANVRLVWITMLAMADRRGRVWASLPGLADRARVPDEDCRTAIKTFLSPDADSRTREHEGRRIEVIDGGWRLLNHEKYRAIRDEESIKDSKRNYINKRRAAEKQANVENVERGRTPSNDVSQCRANADAEADADAEAEIKEEEREPSAPVASLSSASKEVKAAAEIPEALRTPEFMAAWSAWEQHRVERKSKLTKTSRGMQLKALEAMGVSRSIAALNHSITNSYQGIFEPKQLGTFKAAPKTACKPHDLEAKDFNLGL